MQLLSKGLFGAALLLGAAAASLPQPQALLGNKPLDNKRNNNDSTQHFACAADFTRERCLQEVAILKRTIDAFPTKTLGNWTWVLVRSEAWKGFVSSRGLDPDSPTFTFLPNRTTYVEEALLAPVPGRDRELLDRWRVRPDTLLE